MFRQMKINEVALLLQGLRAIHVADEQAAHAKLTKMLETELASRGVSLKSDEVFGAHEHAGSTQHAPTV